MELPAKSIWEGIYRHLRDVPVQHGTYNDDRRVAEFVEEATNARLAIDAGKPVYLGHEAVGLLASTLAASCGRVCVLDFGGGLALGFLHLVVALQENTVIEYHVVELDKMCAAGNQLYAQDPRIQFHTVLPNLSGRPDIVYVRTALQYVEEYSTQLQLLASLNAPYLLLAHLAAGHFPTHARRQLNLPGQVLPYWFLNLGEVIQILRGAGYVLAHAGNDEGVFSQKVFPMRNLLFVRAPGPVSPMKEDAT